LTLLRRTLPDLPLHASTQMSIFTSGGAAEAAEAGCSRVVIARECSREETAAICARCPAEIEVFVHGALCMCYSGQCAMSALIGGRSGNRGACAQPCRLPYAAEGAGRSYPLSLKDSCLADALGEMADMGVACLKLEGRMKRPEYVAVVTGIYARLLREGRGPTAAERAELDAAFSRSGFTDWYWRGKKGPGMFGTRPENAPEPKELFAAARAVYEKGGQRTVPVRFSCSVLPERPCVLCASDEDGHAVTVTGPVPETARSHAVTEEELFSRLRKTGGTAYSCVETTGEIGAGLSLSAAAVNALRRDALAELSNIRTAPPERRKLPPPPLPEDTGAAAEPRFTVSVTNAAQVTPELLSCAPARIYVPLEDLDGPGKLPESGAEWCAALPRVWRDRDETELRRLLERAARRGVTGVLLGNLGQLPLVRDSGLALYGDFGLNVFNSRALDFLRERGLRSACASFELRGAQLRDLRKPLPVEAIVYGRLPLMVTENCLIRNASGCPAMSGGPLVRACAGRRCAAPGLLRDRTGAEFPLLPLWGHRTEIENCRPLYLCDRADWRELGLAFARLRFTDESPERCARVFRDCLAGAEAPAEFTRGLFDRGVE